MLKFRPKVNLMSMHGRRKELVKLRSESPMNEGDSRGRVWSKCRPKVSWRSVGGCG